MVELISQVFSEPVSDAPLAGQATLPGIAGGNRLAADSVM